MVRRNDLQRKVLITPHEVIFHGPTEHTIDPRRILHSIIIAEERFIRPALGDDFYDQLLDQKNIEVTSENQTSLQAELAESMAGIQNIPTLVAGDIVNKSTGLNADNLTLWKQHLWKLTAECVLLAAYPEGFAQFSSSGVVHSNPQSGVMMTSNSNLTTPDLRSMKWMMDKKLMDRIDPLLDAMHTWICRKGVYTLYGKPCDCDANGTPHKRKSDWILGLYDEDDEDKCCGNV